MSKPLKAAELKTKTLVELEQLLSETLRSKFKQNLVKSSGEMAKTHFIRIIKRNVARIETVIKQLSGQSK